MANWPKKHQADGEEFTIDPKAGMTLACCDCHLVHNVTLRIEGKKVVFCFSRNNRSTSMLRHYHGVPINDTTNTAKP